jgi:hypothetical protein
MVYHLSIECIGEGGGLRGSDAALAALFFGKPSSRAWVAKVKYMRGNYVDREFIQGKKDYANSNGPGSRGIYKHYFLDDGLYEISSPQSWKETDRYFAYVESGEMWRVTREEAQLWVDQQNDCSE